MAVVTPGPSSPQSEVPTSTGALTGVAPFMWTGSGWVPQSAGDGTNTTVSFAAGSVVGGITPRVAATYTRASDATTYAAGDMIGNTTTAANVVPISFTVARVNGGSGRITGCRCVVTAASGTIVLPAFDLLLFKPESNIPFAAGSYPADNAALNVAAAAMIHMTAVFSFSATGWRNQAGAATAAGTGIYQTAAVSPRPYASFNLASVNVQTLLGIMQAQNAWAPGAVSQQFDFLLDVDQD